MTRTVICGSLACSLLSDSGQSRWIVMSAVLMKWSRSPSAVSVLSRFDGDDDALCAVSPTPHHLHAEIILPAVTDSHLCFQFSHAEWMKFTSSSSDFWLCSMLKNEVHLAWRRVCSQLELVRCWNCAWKVGCLNISSDRSPVSCNLTLGDILQPNERQERGSRRPRMSALLASGARFYASTVDRRRLQVMARRGVATLVEVVSYVLSSCTCFFLFCFVFVENMTLRFGLFHLQISTLKTTLSVSSAVMFLHVYASFIIQEKPNHIRKKRRGHRMEGRGEVLPSPRAWRHAPRWSLTDYTVTAMYSFSFVNVLDTCGPIDPHPFLSSVVFLVPRLHLNECTAIWWPQCGTVM